MIVVDVVAVDIQFYMKERLKNKIFNIQFPLDAFLVVVDILFVFQVISFLLDRCVCAYLSIKA